MWSADIYARVGAERGVNREEPVTVSSALSTGRSGQGTPTACCPTWQLSVSPPRALCFIACICLWLHSVMTLDLPSTTFSGSMSSWVWNALQIYSPAGNNVQVIKKTMYPGLLGSNISHCKLINCIGNLLYALISSKIFFLPYNSCPSFVQPRKHGQNQLFLNLQNWEGDLGQG